MHAQNLYSTVSAPISQLNPCHKAATQLSTGHSTLNDVYGNIKPMEKPVFIFTSGL